MKIIESIEEMQEYSQQLKRKGKTITAVETSGYLHDGHMSLVKIAQDIENTNIVVSTWASSPLNIYMEWPENYKEILIEQESLYIKTSLMEDLELCQAHDVDVFFHPSMLDYYQSPIQTITVSHDINRHLLDNSDTFILGKSLINTNISYIKEWNTICPDIVIVGQKDIHQSVLLKKTVTDLNFPIKVIIAPTLRDSDGLAFSSRNKFLSDSERQDATSVYQTLHEVSRWFTYPSIEKIKEHIIDRITNATGNIIYIDICCAKTLEELDVIDKETVIVVSTKFGEVDVWDNIIIDPERIKR